MACVKKNIFFLFFFFCLSILFFVSSRNRKTITRSSNHPPGAKDIDMFINFLLLNKRRRQQQHTYMPLDTITKTTLCTTYVGSTGCLSFEFLCMYKYSCDKTISIQLSIVVKVSLDAKVKTK